MSEAKNDICTIIREAEKEEVLITRHGKPAAVVIGFRDEDDWFGYKIEHDEKFLRRIANPFFPLSDTHLSDQVPTGSSIV